MWAESDMRFASSKSNIFSQIQIIFYLGVVATSFSCPPLPTGPALQGPNTPGDHRDLQRLLNRGERVLLRPTSQILQHNPQLLQNWKTAPCRRDVCPCLWWGSPLLGAERGFPGRVLLWQVHREEGAGDRADGGKLQEGEEGGGRWLWGREVCKVPENDLGPHGEVWNQYSSSGLISVCIFSSPIFIFNLQVVSVISMSFVAVSIVGMVISTMPQLKSVDAQGNLVENPRLALIETVCIAWFTLEYFLRYESV